MMSSVTECPVETLPLSVEPSDDEPTTSLQNRAPVGQSESDDLEDAPSDNEENVLESHSHSRTSQDQASSREPIKLGDVGNDGDPEAQTKPTKLRRQVAQPRRPAHWVPQVSDHKQTTSGRSIRPPRWHTAFAAGSNVSLAGDIEPNGYEEAIRCESSAYWKEAMKEEYDSLVENLTFERVEKIPSGKKAIGSKFVFKLKQNHDESVRHKARMVIKGYEQVYRIDYSKTFALVAKMATIRILLALAASFNYEIDQMDVKTAFLNPNLYEEVYIRIPDGFYMPGMLKGSIVRLLKALYGLKQAPREWYTDIHSFFCSLSFLRCRYDYDLYLRHDCIIVLWVDDMLVIGKRASVDDVKKSLAEKYRMTDLGPARTFLGWQISRIVRLGL